MFKKFTSRAVIVAFIVILEAAFIALTATLFSYTILWLRILGTVTAALTIIFIVNKSQPPEFKLPWIILLAFFPMFGTIIYVFFGNAHFSRKQQRNIRQIVDSTEKFVKGSGDVDAITVKEAENYAGLARYLSLNTISSATAFNHTEFLPSGEAFLNAVKKDLSSAEKFIFLEYFIIEEGEMWNPVLDILKQKAADGVAVKIIYDDIGCAGKLKQSYCKKLKVFGIDCKKFNAVTLRPSGVYNNRDHRKIAVIDGTIGYMSGINFADEYINVKHPFGHWKDTGVKLVGKSVATLTAMFLSTFFYKDGAYDDLSKFFPEKYPEFDEGGCVIPFGCGPLHPYDYQLGKSTILELIVSAKKSVYITTPYLIVDHELLYSIGVASMRGVDVRIITPHIPDKKFIHAMTKSSYLPLIKKGVKIYEYTPGFIHAKQILVDDKAALIGTINLDYRSLAHHFECGTILVNTTAISDIKKDFEEILSVSEQMTVENSGQNPLVRIILSMFALFRTLL